MKLMSTIAMQPKTRYRAMYLIAGDLSFHQAVDSAATSTGATVCCGATICCAAFLLRLAPLPLVVAAVVAAITSATSISGSPSITGVASTLGFLIGGRVIGNKGMQWARLFLGVIAPLLTA